jgi:hypothetical protein
MFPRLQQLGERISGAKLKELWSDPVFQVFGELNVLPLIYNEKAQKCNILVFDHETARSNIATIVLEGNGRGRIHPVYRFYDHKMRYVCEVRYGGGTANALQRGLWTNTKNGGAYFDSITNGWISYAHNVILVKLFSHALLSTSKGHERALKSLLEDIEEQKNMSSIKAPTYD